MRDDELRVLQVFLLRTEFVEVGALAFPKSLCAIRRSGRLCFGTMGLLYGFRRMLAYDVVRRCVCSASTVTPFDGLDNVGEGAENMSVE